MSGPQVKLHDEYFSPLDERRERALHAGQDQLAGLDMSAETLGALEEAVETATRVRITPEVLAAGYPSALTERDRRLCKPLLIAAFEAAGFEVEA